MKKTFLSALLCVIAVFIACDKVNKKESNSSVVSIEKDIENTANAISSRFEDKTDMFHDGLKSIEENGKFGFVDSLGNIVIKPQFDEVGCFNEGLASVCIEADRHSYVTNKGDTVNATTGGKYGFINKKGEYVVKPQYDFCSFFSQDVAVVCKNDKWGYIDKTGEEIIKLQYDEAEDFWDKNGFAAVSKDGKWGLIDIKGNIIVPLEHESASSTSDGVAIVFTFDNGKLNVYNDGRIVKVNY